MSFDAHYEKQAPLTDPADGLSDDENFNLGYLLEWTSFRTVVVALEWGVRRGLEANSRFTDVDNFDLANAVNGYPRSVQPTTVDTAVEVSNEIIYRISRIPLTQEVDSELHVLLDSVRASFDYIRHFAVEEHSRQQG